jgi:uncharacterized protein YecE (DUF72 family)
MAEIRMGTSAFTAAGWKGSFYPRGIKPAEYLSFYATRYNTVELDNTFYRTPSLSTVKGWYSKTPLGFVFAAKIPQVVTHERVLVDCDEDFVHFLRTMDALGEKLGPLLFQFGYFNRSKFKSGSEFLSRLQPFLKKLPQGYKFAIEIRNRDWLDARFVDVLRERGVALALIDQSWMPHPWEMKGGLDLITADFTYVRWLGDRKEIEEQTTTWDKTIIDRKGELFEWVKLLKKIHERRIMILAFANNHYAGHGPGTLELFRRLWGADGLPAAARKQPTMFDE